MGAPAGTGPTNARVSGLRGGAGTGRPGVRLCYKGVIAVLPVVGCGDGVAGGVPDDQRMRVLQR